MNMTFDQNPLEQSADEIDVGIDTRATPANLTQAAKFSKPSGQVDTSGCERPIPIHRYERINTCVDDHGDEWTIHQCKRCGKIVSLNVRTF